MELLFKGTFADVRLECTVTGEFTFIPRAQAAALHERGLIHPGEDSHTLADGKTWTDVEAALIALGAAC